MRQLLPWLWMWQLSLKVLIGSCCVGAPCLRVFQSRWWRQHSFYTGPRGMYAEMELWSVRAYPSRGVAPGCPWAMSFAKAYVLEPFRQIAACNLRTQLSIFVDDIVVAAEGKKSEVCAQLVSAGEMVLQTIEDDLKCSVALEKVVLVASHGNLACSVQRSLGLPNQVLHKSAVFLGGEYAAGQQRHRWSSQSNGRNKRFSKVLQRRRKLKAFRTAAGQAAERLAKTGIIPAAAHACEIMGVSDAELHRFQRLAAQVMTPKAKRRSLTALRLVKQDPAEVAAFAPILRWSKEVWLAVTGSAHAMRLPEMRRLWPAAFPGNVRNWSQAAGPMSAAVMSARRLGWKFSGPFVVVLPTGVRVPLTAVSPALIRRLAEDAWRGKTEQELAKKWLKDGWEGGEDPQGLVPNGDISLTVPLSARAIRQAVRDKSLTPLEAGSLVSVATDAVWPRQRLFDAGLASEPTCIRCGRMPDATHHRAWTCPETEQLRTQIATAAQIRAACTAPNSLIWSRGWLPYAASVEPPPADLELRCWDLAQGERCLSSLSVWAGSMTEWIFVDGSANTAQDRRSRRAGWSCVEVAPYLINGQLVVIRAV